MKNILAILCFFVVSDSICTATSYRLFNEHFLDVGNTWNYRVHITKMDNSTVNLWGDSSQQVTGTAVVNSITTKKFETNGALGYSKKYGVQNANFLLLYKEEGDNYSATLTSGNPFEMYPISVLSTDNNNHFGNGNFNFNQISPAMTWTAVLDSYITYLRQEQISVIAGTFQCTVVYIKTIRLDDDGYRVTTEETDWIDPHLGIIKANVTETTWDGSTNWVSVYTYDLSSTNVSPASFCVSQLAMDFNSDCRVNFSDFAVFAQSWMACNLDPQSACSQ
jgi:hypothetical protein